MYLSVCVCVCVCFSALRAQRERHTRCALRRDSVWIVTGDGDLLNPGLAQCLCHTFILHLIEQECKEAEDGGLLTFCLKLLHHILFLQLSLLI